MDTRKVKVCAWIPSDLRSQWDEAFGEYGSLAWLMETSMREMLAVAANSPSRTALIQGAIREFVSKLATEREAARTTQR